MSVNFYKLQDGEEKDEEDMQTEEEPADSSLTEVGSDKKGLKRSHQEKSVCYILEIKNVFIVKSEWFLLIRVFY